MTRPLGTPRTTGALLVASLLIVLVAAAVMVVSGALSVFFDLLGGSLAGLEPYLGVFRLSILIVVSALFGLNGVSWFFFGPVSSLANMAENIGVSVAGFEGTYSVAANEVSVNAKRVAVYLTAIGVMGFLAAVSGLRHGSGRARVVTWVLVFTTAAIGLVELQGVGLGPFGAGMLVLAVVGLIGQFLARGRAPAEQSGT